MLVMEAVLKHFKRSGVNLTEEEAARKCVGSPVMTRYIKGRFKRKMTVDEVVRMIDDERVGVIDGGS